MQRELRGRAGSRLRPQLLLQGVRYEVSYVALITPPATAGS